MGVYDWQNNWGSWGKPWSVPYEGYPWTDYLPKKKEEKPKVDIIDRFTVSHEQNQMVLRGNLAGFAKTSVNVFFESGKLHIITSGGTFKFSTDCSAQIYNWNGVSTAWYEGSLTIVVPKHPKISNRIDVKL